MDKSKKILLGLYEKSMPNTLSIKEKLEMTKKCGFDYLELSIDESDEKLARLDWSKEQRKEIVDWMYETGVSIGSICLSGHRKYPLGSSDPSRSLEIMEKAIILAKDLGIRLIQLAGYDVYYEEGNLQTRQNFINNLKVSARMASLYGVILGFETMETPFMDTVEKAMHFVKMIDNPYLGVYPDIGNLKNASLLYKTSVNEDLMTGKGHIFACHLKETVPGKYREIPFGTGHSEFVENIALAYSLGVLRFVGEFWYVGQENWQEDIKFANTFLRQKIQEALHDE